MKKFFQQKIEWISPLFAYKKLRNKSNFLFFSGTTSGKYSFIPLEGSEIQEIYANQKNSFETIQKEFLEFQNEYDISSLVHWSFPFCGGLSSMFSYEYSHEFEKNIWNTSSLKNPLAIISLSEKLLAFNHETQECFLAGWFPEKTPEKHVKFFTEITKQLHAPKKKDEDEDEEEKSNQDKISKIQFLKNISKKEYLNAFAQVQTEIEKGNSFQVNLSQGFTANMKETIDPFDIFITATEKNPAPFMAFYEWSNTKSSHAVISCSPERLFSLNSERNIWTQPIAGTRPRGKTEEEEEKFEKELNTSIKEQSEHAMLVDLLRNDFGKISEFGSVNVKDFARIEKYETVMHLVSDIEGILAEDKTAFDVFKAVFPGGTITGAPKRETMKILEKLEEELRGFYCGSTGYISLDGQSDYNILIRTLEYYNGVLKGRAGGGIVYNSDGSNEYEESLVKWSGIEKIFKK